MKLSTTYEVVAGDTFATIAAKSYGIGAESFRIAKANPGLAEPLTPGVLVVVPDLPGAPTNVPTGAAASNPSEVAVLIDGERFRFWDRLRVTRAIDVIDSVELGAPFQVNLPAFREAFRPFSYKPVQITVGGAPLFTGTMVAVNPTVDAQSSTIAASAYATAGVLQDSTPPASAYPIEFRDVSLRDIATTMAAPFGVSVVFDAEPGAVFSKVECKPGKKVLTFLTDLAKQRNLVASSTPDGSLLFSQSIAAGQPVAQLEEGQSPVISVAPFFTPQEYYSHITGLQPVVVGLAGSQFTTKNPRLQGVTRPFTYTVQDTDGGDLRQAVEAKTARMFGNMAAYSVKVATWRDPAGNLWAPNTTVNLVAPRAMIYNNYEFLIRSVEFDRDAVSEIATLNLVIPGSFSGQLPEVLPWEE